MRFDPCPSVVQPTPLDLSASTLRRLLAEDGKLGNPSRRFFNSTKQVSRCCTSASQMSRGGGAQAPGSNLDLEYGLPQTSAKAHAHSRRRAIVSLSRYPHGAIEPHHVSNVPAMNRRGFCTHPPPTHPDTPTTRLSNPPKPQPPPKPAQRLPIAAQQHSDRVRQPRLRALRQIDAEAAPRLGPHAGSGRSTPCPQAFAPLSAASTDRDPWSRARRSMRQGRRGCRPRGSPSRTGWRPLRVGRRPRSSVSRSAWPQDHPRRKRRSRRCCRFRPQRKQRILENFR